MKINKKNWLILSLVGLVGFFLFREAVRNGIGMPGIGVTRSRIGESGEEEVLAHYPLIVSICNGMVSAIYHRHARNIWGHCKI